MQTIRFEALETFKNVDAKGALSVYEKGFNYTVLGIPEHAELARNLEKWIAEGKARVIPTSHARNRVVGNGFVT